jgi:hypothetical protein
LKADARKDKWWHRLTYTEKIAAGIDQQDREAWCDAKRALDWPRKVWKHYYALPADIWDDKLLECLPSQKSGVLLLSQKPGEFMRVDCRRRATPNKDAMRLKPEQVMDIARLANLRMWEAYRDSERLKKDADYWREQSKETA